jgi:tetratricopeptide (TPR) repeat protein
LNLADSYGAAVLDCNLALLLNDDLPAAYFERAEAYEGEGNTDDAIADFDRFIALTPSDPSGYYGRAMLLAEKGDYTNAIADCDRVISLAPLDAHAYDNRGYYQTSIGNYAAATRDFERAMALDPKLPSPYNNLAWLLAVTPDAKWRDGKKALEYAQRACLLTHWQEPTFIDTLAAAYAENGDFTNAVKWESQVLPVMPPEDRTEAQNALHLYQQGRPYREGGK